MCRVFYTCPWLWAALTWYCFVHLVCKLCVGLVSDISVIHSLINVLYTVHEGVIRQKQTSRSCRHLLSLHLTAVSNLTLLIRHKNNISKHTRDIQDKNDSVVEQISGKLKKKAQIGWVLVLYFFYNIWHEVSFPLFLHSWICPPDVFLPEHSQV